MNLEIIENYSLSDMDIKSILPPANIISYKQLAKYKNINDVFNNSDIVILFFEEQEEHNNEIGHWQLLMKDDDKIIFFDSYGLLPDQCKKWLSINNLVELKE